MPILDDASWDRRLLQASKLSRRTEHRARGKVDVEYTLTLLVLDWRERTPKQRRGWVSPAIGIALQGSLDPEKESSLR
jgi:hypothetical protein